MMYKLNRRLIPILDASEVGEDEILVEIMTLGEFDQTHKGTYHHELLMDSMEHIQYCKAEILRSCIIGTILVPDKQDLLEKEFGFGFYIHKGHLLFIDDTERIQKIASRLPEIKATDTTLEARFFLELLEFFINDDVLYLQRYEDMLISVEEELLENEMMEDFHTDMLRYRREILILNGYYQQFTEFMQMIAENKNRMFNDEDCRLFKVVANRVDRLYDNTKMLREYTAQLRELHKSQIDIMQNKTMRVLTLVTTSKHGYLGVIALSATVVIGEIIFFKRKKWFD